MIALRSYLRPGNIVRALLGVMLVYGCALRVHEIYIIHPLDQLFSDPGRHWEHAKQTLSFSPWQLIDPPIFQMWMSLVQKWSMGGRLLTGAYQIGLSLVTPWVWYRFFRLTLRSRTLALAGWAILACLPSWIAIFGYFMTETLFLPLMGASLWQTAIAERKRTVGSFSGMVALWLVTGLTRGIALPLGGIAGCLVWIRHPHKIRTVFWSAVVTALIAVPFAIRNHEYLGLWSPVGSGWPSQIYTESGRKDINIDLSRNGASWGYGFGSPSLYTEPLAPLSHWHSRRVGTVKISIDLTRGARDWKAAYERNVVRGWARAELRMENVLLVMMGPSWPDSDPRSQVAQVANAMRWVWAPLFLVVVVLAIARPRATLKQPLLPVLIVIWFFFQASSLLAVNEGRYRKPLEGLLVAQVLVLLDSSRLSSWRPRWRRRRAPGSAPEGDVPRPTVEEPGAAGSVA
jgi:hypothetical protein